MVSRILKRVCLSTCGLLTAAACVMPMGKAEASGAAGSALAAGLGAAIGAAIGTDIAHHNQHHRQVHHQRGSAVMQQRTMRYVLTNYNPAFHQAWVQYVVVDCSRVLNANQQNQLLDIMNQRYHQVGCPVPHRVVETRTYYPVYR